MNGGSFGYLVRQGITNVWLNRLMSLASIGILTACLILLGGAGLIAVNMNDMFNALEDQNEVVVFLTDDATQAQIKSVGDKLESMEEVAEVRFISSEQALANERARMGDRAYLYDLFEEDNPFPASYNVKLHSLADLKTFESAAAKLPGVLEVSSPTQLAEVMTGVRRTLLILGIVIIGILLVASIVVISNTIRITVFSRRKEINIMKYVGATNRFIRLPFKVEGITIGIISAVVAFVVIFFVYQSLEGMLLRSQASWVQWMSGSLIPFSALWYWVLAGFAVAGMLIGFFGSSSAMRKHLRV